MDVIFPEYEEFHTRVVFYRVLKTASASIYEHLGRANLINLHVENFVIPWVLENSHLAE